MLKYLSLIMIGVVAIAISGAIKTPSEQYLRQRVVQIHNDKASCSGEQVQAPSGKMYVLTAGHCRKLLEFPDVVITDAAGKNYKPKFVAEDTRSDLLLLAGIPKLQGLKVAKEAYGQEHVRSFTHGAGYATYKTEGEMVQATQVNIPVFAVQSEEDAKACNMPKFKVETSQTFFGPMTLCILSVQENVATAAVVPGSSGGMLVNDAGELVGVVSASNSSTAIFGFFVRTKDINRFLKKF